MAVGQARRRLEIRAAGCKLTSLNHVAWHPVAKDHAAFFLALQLEKHFKVRKKRDSGAKKPLADADLATATPPPPSPPSPPPPPPPPLSEDGGGLGRPERKVALY